MPKISVIMSVYNTREEWLREAIESILNQTFTDFEFIIINDGSTNNVKDVVLSYKDERIKYIEQENQGPAVARNIAIEIAKGTYIAIMDSDDISLSTRFKKQVDFLESNKDISIVGCWFEVFPQTSIIKHPRYPKYIDFLNYCCIGHPTVMFRKNDFEKYNLKYNPEYLCEDYELWSRAIKYLKFANIQETLLRYRWHENNFSKPTKNFMSHDKQVKENMLNFLTDDTELQEKLQSIIFQTHLKFVEQIFSIKNSYNKTHKVITLLGIKIKLKKETNNAL